MNAEDKSQMTVTNLLWLNFSLVSFCMLPYLDNCMLQEKAFQDLVDPMTDASLQICGFHTILQLLLLTAIGVFCVSYTSTQGIQYYTKLTT